MPTSVGKSFEYNVLCPVCGFKRKNYEMRQRWDGLMVCPEDFETRHISDFYQTRNDVHQLPYIYPDNNGTNVGVINTSVLTPPYPGASLSSALTGLGIVGVGDVGIAEVGRIT